MTHENERQIRSAPLPPKSIAFWDPDRGPFAQDDTAAHRLTKKYRYPARLWQWLKNEPALTSEKNPYAYDNQNRI